MPTKRVSGVLLHITSLPSHGGVGDFGPAARAFVDFLAAGKQRLWQVLPLSPTGYGSSPYSALSAFAGNPVLISLELLAEQGWIAWDRLSTLPGAEGNADFGVVWDRKLPLLEEAAGNFIDRATPVQRAPFEQFCNENASWLNDYAMYAVLRRLHNYASWHQWPEPYARREAAAMQMFIDANGRELAIEQAMQFFFAQQWSSLREYCAAREIKILGDIAIFVSYDSADVWTHPHLFELNTDLEPIRVSGVPPDYFSAEGQRWGNPLYRWDLMQETGFDWWVARIRRSLQLYDIIRLDHFRGFEAYWAINADEPTAINGKWVKAPGHALFQRLRDVFGDLPFIAEDLGVITPEVDQLRLDFGMPGMRVLQFGFSDRGSHIYLPHQYVPNTVTYTGTHDNNTTLGWWRDDASAQEREHVQTYCGRIDDPNNIVWTMIRAAAGSVADTCIFPLQDILHLGSEARMNTPSAPQGNWTWRYHPGALHRDLSAQLATLMEMTDRDGYVPPPEA